MGFSLVLFFEDLLNTINSEDYENGESERFEDLSALVSDAKRYAAKCNMINKTTGEK